jgi:prevent-host-death family protein
MDRVVGAYEAKTKLPELLREVDNGHRITITVRGRPVAELSPPRTSAPSVQHAVDAMKAFERVAGVADAELSDWIATGRR